MDLASKRYFELYDLAPLGHLTLDEHEYIKESNLATSFMLKLDRKMVVNQVIFPFIFKDDQDIYYFFKKKLIATGKSHSCELRMVKNDGEQFWVQLEGIAVQTDPEGPREIRLILSDITEKVKLLKINSEQEAELRNLYQVLNSSSIVALTDIFGNITYVSDKFCQMSQYSREELIGKNPSILNSGHQDNQFYKELWNTISSGKIWTGEIKIRAKDGTFYWIFTTIVPSLDKSGKPFQYVSIIIDNTKRKEIEIELFNNQMDKRVALEMIEERKKFMDIAAHELRTPITSLSLFLQIAEKKIERGLPLTTDMLKKLRNPIDRLARLVTDLLDMSRQERGLMVLLPKEIDIGLLVSECIEEFKLQAPGIRFIFEKPNHELKINIDPLRINQVLSNLLDNATKYAAEGAIEIALIDLSNNIRVSVTDHGAGIPKEQQAELFKAFSRGNSNDTIRAPGLGLGLSVCKGIIALHNGTIGVVSSEGKGSTFYFDLPKKNINL
jgi:PAS domain S-box-containing protein